ncbi:glycosyltransferase family 4 protein [Pedomonas sp. V897]|uniref:glycosyltransferase family 4 protein n=1 Tax=Pedomonas sp. V897 TaxID=3446482 RepID=UPI003EDEE589
MAKTVLSVISTLARTGPVNVLHGITSNYDPQRYRAVIATLSPEPEQSRLKDFQARGIEIHQLNLSRLRSMLDGKQQLATLIEKIGPSVIHTHGARADILASSIPWVRGHILSTIHADLRTDYRMAYGVLRGTFLATRHIKSLRCGIRPIAVSPAVAEALGRENVHADIILNGIDTELFRPLSSREEVKHLREALGFPVDATIFLHTGVLIPRKRPLDVIKSFVAADLGPSAFLVFVGDGPLRQECEAAARGMPSIRFLGPRSDVPKLLQASDALVSASVSEGLPMALIEGAATGTRILASDIQAHQLVRNLFPAQVDLFNTEHTDSLTSLFRQFYSSEGSPSKGMACPNPEGLHQISATTMSKLYQDCYDEIGT